MCTVTVVPLANGFRLACNRDERRDRPRALPPRVHVSGGRRCLWPVDPAGGGTWIGVNDAGVAMALLNRNPATSARSNRFSRGRIIPMLLGSGSIDAALREAMSIDAASLAPFLLVVVADAAIGVVTTNGRRRALTRSCFRRPVLYTSSSLGDARVDGPRRKLFERLVVGDPEALVRGQASFHQHRWAQRPETSVLMSRPDAATVSRTVVEVTNGEIKLAYEDLDTTPLTDERVTRWEFGLL
jgi:Transport and Golgi organisation 2